jgi:prophage antirepressor-like protein
MAKDISALYKIYPEGRPREVVLEAVRKNGKALQHADKSLKADREMALATVRQNAEVFEYAAKELQKDKKFKRIVAGYAKAQKLAGEWMEKSSGRQGN